MAIAAESKRRTSGALGELPKARGYGFNPRQLVRLRKKRKMSQRQLAEATGLSRMGIVKYEQGLSEPRMGSIDVLARELMVGPEVFFQWSYATAPRPEEPEEDETAVAPLAAAIPCAGNASSEQLLAHNLAVLGNTDLRALQKLAEALLFSDNPLDQDKDLWDRDLAELRQVTPRALHKSRGELGLSIHDVGKLSGIPTWRLLEIEASRGLAIEAGEIFALRKALGLRFDPRAAAVPYLGKARSGPSMLKESVREWQQRCQHTPNKLDKVMQRLNSMEERLNRSMDGLESRLQRLKA